MEEQRRLGGCIAKCGEREQAAKEVLWRRLPMSGAVLD